MPVQASVLAFKIMFASAHERVQCQCASSERRRMHVGKQGHMCNDKHACGSMRVLQPYNLLANKSACNVPSKSFSFRITRQTYIRHVMGHTTANSETPSSGVPNTKNLKTTGFTTTYAWCVQNPKTLNKGGERLHC